MVARLFIVALLTSVSSAYAQSVAMIDERPSLTWRAPADCPDTASVRARVEQRIERSLDGTVVGIEVDVALSAGRYVARVDLRAMTVANDVRTLQARRCAELADAVAVIVARVAGEAIAKQRVAVRDTEASTSRLVDLPPAAKPVSRTWTLGARISGVNGIGVIPKVGVAAEGAVTLRRKNRMFELGVTRWFESVAQRHDGAPAKVDVALDTVAARYGWRPEQLPLRAWLAFEWGHMSGANRRIPTDQLEEGRWLAAGAGFGIAWQMKPWVRLFGANESMVALDRVRFTLGNGLVVYAPSPMSFRTIVGLEMGWQ